MATAIKGLRCSILKNPRITDELIQTSYQLGEAAFNNGIKSAPYLDKKMMDIFADLKLEVGEGGDDLMKAWLKGWTEANLRSN